MTLAAARAGDEQAFAELVAGHRRELTAHCYRMLGSIVDAEDAVQEAMLRAWKGLDTFREQSSMKTWLYRIATTVSLRMAQRRPARVLSWEHAPARGPMADLGTPQTGPVFVDPWLGLSDDPAEGYGRRETIELAYVAALQHLTPNQRAVLVLRDVLAFSAAEVAELLHTSLASVNSALQRARATLALETHGPSQQVERVTAEQRGVVEAFSTAFERADVNALIALLTEDVRFTMPPLSAWFAGREDVARFYAERVFATPWRQVRIREVNGQPALLGYQEQNGMVRPGALQVLSFRAGRISWVAAFIDPQLVERLEVPEIFRDDR